ncbi:Shedu immune nuclease family protein [Floridanema evergladense]|uniref:Shedu immune nuclease family protein n=1 Tax=Floridaenema evergladense BLCC-F167 TaxID=3153639 RepID=A0ABV4WQM1_9CYAN
MADFIDSPIEYCKQCGQSLVPLKMIHVKRPCKECGQSFYIFELGENGQGMRIREGDQPIIPAGVIRLSLDFTQANGKFTREGISWFAQMLFFQDQASTPEELSLTLDKYHDYAISVWESSPLIEELDLNSEAGWIEFGNRLQENQNSPEWWAGWVLKGISQVRENLEKGNLEDAIWAMNILTNSRAMLIFKQVLEKTVWSGYMISNLKNVLKIWQDNKDNSDEEFWQKTFWENSIVLSQVFSFPVILLEDKAYVGGKKIDDKGGNLVDFILANNLSENTVLVEIKTPKTPLLGSLYRGGVHNISSEITGALLQVSNYKDSLIKDYHRLKSESDKSFYAFNPQCLVIAGTWQNEVINQDQKKSFELFRNGLKDVQIITYDELFRKIEILIDLLEGKKI